MIYDNIASNYDSLFKYAERLFLYKWRSETLSYLPEDSTILEIGAGTGLNFCHYPNFRKAIASEISLKMIEFARMKTSSIQLIQADAEILPFPDDSFDAAFATLVFCSINKPKKSFRELKRVIRKGGVIVLLEHVRPKGLLGFVFDFINIFTMPLIQDCFNRNTASIAELAGLKIEKVIPKAFGIVNLIVCKV